MCRLAALVLPLALVACRDDVPAPAPSSDPAPPAASAPAPSNPATPAPSATPVRTVTAQEALGVLSGPETFVIDVRTPEEFAGGHLAGAQNLDVNAPDFEARAGALDRSKTYVLYCRTGNRSTQAAQKMQALGFTSLVNAGGFDDLAAAGLPVER